MNGLVWWLRATGVLYVLNGIMMAVVKAPMRAAGPAGSLERVANGDLMARFASDTWVGFGLEVFAIGVVLLIFSAKPHQAIGLAWSVIAIEVARGLVYDAYMLGRGYSLSVYGPWLVIHSVVILAGILALRSAQTNRVAAGAVPSA